MQDVIHASIRSVKGQTVAHCSDAYYFNGTIAGPAQMDQLSSFGDDLEPGNALFAVFDGHDPRDDGAQAAFEAASSLSEHHDKLVTDSFDDEITHWLQCTNDQLNAAGSGTSSAAVLSVCGKCVYLAHIGDCRIYRWNEGVLSLLTHDHTKVQTLEDAGILSPDQVRFHPQKDLVTDSLGQHSQGMMDGKRYLYRPMPLIDRDRYLICSDGVSDYLSIEQLGKLIGSGKDADDCADAIWDAMLAAGGNDSATLIVLELRINADPTPVHEVKSKGAGSVRMVSKQICPSAEDPDRMAFAQTYEVTTPGGKCFRIRTEISGDDIDFDTFPGLTIEVKPFMDAVDRQDQVERKIDSGTDLSGRDSSRNE